MTSPRVDAENRALKSYLSAIAGASKQVIDLMASLVPGRRNTRSLNHGGDYVSGGDDEFTAVHTEGGVTYEITVRRRPYTK